VSFATASAKDLLIAHKKTLNMLLMSEMLKAC